MLLINHGDAAFQIRRGERIAQMVIAPVTQAELVAVVSLSATDRGSAALAQPASSRCVRCAFILIEITPNR